eukprot:scaffold27108_cov90-Isochrysis_galbana.AAC.1
MDAGSADAATRELRMLSSLVGYVSSTEQAEQLVQLFLPYLRIKPTPRAENVKAQVLALLAGLLSRLESPQAHARFLGLQFGNLRSRESRAALCRAWAALATEVDARGGGGASTARGGDVVRSGGAGDAGTAGAGRKQNPAGGAGRKQNPAGGAGRKENPAGGEATKHLAGVVARPSDSGAAAPSDCSSLRGLGRVAALLTELNAYAPDAIEERDYDRRIDGYNSVPQLLIGSPELFLGVPELSTGASDPGCASHLGAGVVGARDSAPAATQPPPAGLGCVAVLPLMCQCVHDIETDDIALRHSASHTLTLLVRHAAIQASGHADPAGLVGAGTVPPASAVAGSATTALAYDAAPAGGGAKRRKSAAAGVDASGAASAPDPPAGIPALSSGSPAAGPEWRALLTDVLLPALRRGLRLPPEREMVRAEMIRILAEALTAAPFLEPQLATLLNRNNPEADFFFNVVHVQLPRRQRAIARLRLRVEQVRGLGWGKEPHALKYWGWGGEPEIRRGARRLGIPEEGVSRRRAGRRRDS